ncbi:unnamed protein product [Onchocerca flexuosa]|uniref:YscJ_FliF_C domain-containing protein n=1 Tax=Onchocerca flexuosa TaxID=387005 RepID=A0A183I194_9BILA|nr:unnamed protein product [Onchocerca flexuosa]
MITPRAVEGSSTETIELRSRNGNRNNGENRNRWDKTMNSNKVIVERKLRPDDNLNKIAVQYSVSNINEIAGLIRVLLLSNDNFGESAAEKMADDRPLLSSDLSDKSVDELFEKTDAYIAQVRDNLSTDNTGDTVHFVDARSPDATFRGLWFIVVFIIFIFIFVPLILTFVEEEQERSHIAKKSFMKS